MDLVWSKLGFLWAKFNLNESSLELLYFHLYFTFFFIIFYLFYERFKTFLQICQGLVFNLVFNSLTISSNFIITEDVKMLHDIFQITRMSLCTIPRIECEATFSSYYLYLNSGLEGTLTPIFRSGWRWKLWKIKVLKIEKIGTFGDLKEDSAKFWGNWWFFTNLDTKIKVFVSILK